MRYHSKHLPIVRYRPKADSFDGQPLTKAPSITPAAGQDLECHRLRGLWGVDMLVEPLNETAKQAGLDEVKPHDTETARLSLGTNRRLVQASFVTLRRAHVPPRREPRGWGGRQVRETHLAPTDPELLSKVVYRRVNQAAI